MRSAIKWQRMMCNQIIKRHQPKAKLLQDGKWFLPDRMMAEFTGESTSDINRRAQGRNGLELQQASQLIDFTCHGFSAVGKRGPAGSLYPRDSALALLKITNNFARNLLILLVILSNRVCFSGAQRHMANCRKCAVKGAALNLVKRPPPCLAARRYPCPPSVYGLRLPVSWISPRLDVAAQSPRLRAYLTCG